MNKSHAARIAWKDYRRLRAFWIALVAFWTFGLLATSYLALSGQGPFSQLHAADVLVGILSVAMFYGLGWSGITFASEHEENTFGFLRALPVTAKSVFYGKLFYGIPSTLLLIVALGVLSYLHRLLMDGVVIYEWGFDAPAAKLACIWGAGIPVAIAWGLFWSLRVKRPLLAIGLAGGSMVLVAYAGVVAGAVLEAWATGQDMREMREPDFVWATPACLVAAVLLFVVDRGLANRWLPTYESAYDAGARTKNVARPSTAVDESVRNPFGWRRLLWLNLRQSWLATLVLGVIGISLALVGSGDFAPPQSLALAVVGLLGITVFRHEHEQNRYRLLGQFSVRGFPYWLSRVLLPFLAAVLISALVGVTVGRLMYAAHGNVGDTWSYDLPAAWMAFLGGVATFALAQFCSLAFRSTIIALAATMMSAILLWLWFGVCLLLGLPAWLGMMPAVVLPLAATYLRIPRWFRDTESWKQWLVPAVPLLFLILGVPLASACFRVFEIPIVKLPLDESGTQRWLFEPSSAAAVATGEAYVKAFKSVTAPDFAASSDTEEIVYRSEGIDLLRSASTFPDDWVVDPVLVDELMTLSRREECVFPEGFPETDRSYYGVGLLLADAMVKTREGKLDDAWLRYQAVLRLARHRNDGRSGSYGALTAYHIERAVYRELVPWAMEQGDSATRIESAANWLNDYRDEQPRWTAILKGEYAWTTQFIEDFESIQHLLSPEENMQLWFIHRLAPWEFERSRRLRDYFTERSYRQLAAMEANPRLIASGWDDELKKDDQWIATTKFPMVTARGVLPYGFAAATIEHKRRGMVYQLVAIAHHLKTGRYPESFEESALDGSVAIPDDLFFGSGKKMDLVTFRRDANTLDLYIASTARHSRGLTNPIADTLTRHFPLPDFDHWDREAFLRKLDASPHERSREEVNSIAPPGGHFMPGS